MRPTVCICCLLQATDFPENKRGFQPTEAALFVQRPCLEREQMKRMLTARRMRNAPLGAGIRAKRMLTARRMRNAPLGAEVQVKRMLIACRMRNTPLGL